MADTAGSGAKLKDWDSAKDVWELYDLTKDFSQAENLAGKEPERLAEMKELFLVEAQKNKVFPIGAGIWLRLHPGGPHLNAVQKLAVRRDDDTNAGVRRAGTWP